MIHEHVLNLPSGQFGMLYGDLYRSVQIGRDNIVISGLCFVSLLLKYLAYAAVHCQGLRDITVSLKSVQHVLSESHLGQAMV